MEKYGKSTICFFFAGKVKSSLFLGDAPASHVTALAWLKPPFLVPTKQQNCGHKTVHKCAANEWIIMVCNYWLVVEPTSLKNMTSSVGMMTFPIHIYILPKISKISTLAAIMSMPLTTRVVVATFPLYPNFWVLLP